VNDKVSDLLDRIAGWLFPPPAMQPVPLRVRPKRPGVNHRNPARRLDRRSSSKLL
jgi:hypothetical protein